MKQIEKKSQSLKRIGRFAVSIFLALVMVLGLLPGMTGTAKAATNYRVWINGTQLTSDQPTINGTGGGTASYNPNNNTLTLNNFIFAGTGYSDQSNAIIYTQTAITIELQGTNKLTLNSTSGNNNRCIYSFYAMTISGSGSLEITTSNVSGGNTGIYILDALTINGPTITVTAGRSTGGEQNSTGIYTSQLTIKNSTVTSTGGNVNNTRSYGIDSGQSFTIENSTVNATAGTGGQYSIGIYSMFGVNISGSSTKVTATANGTTNSWGISSTQNNVVLSSAQQLVATGKTQAISGKIQNSIDGLGWSDAAGTGTGTKININTSGQELTYRKVRFPGHVHNFTYNPSGATITATCTSGCPDGYDNTNKITLTLKAPTNLTYNGSAKTASISGYPTTPPENLAAKPTTITYYKSEGAGSTTPSGSALSGAPKDAGNYVAQMTWSGKTASRAFTISKANISPSVSMVGYTYGDQASTPTVSGNTGGGDVSWSYAGTANDGTSYGPSDAAPTLAGSYTVTATVKESANYNGGSASKGFTVSRRAVTVSGIEAEDKIYDGTTAAALDYTHVTFNGKLDGDELSVTATGAFADANAGEDKTVNITGWTLGGGSVGNYQPAASGNQETATATIEPRSITDAEVVLNLPSAAELVYDGNPKTVSVKSVTVTIGTTETVLAENTDYTVSGQLTETDADTYTVTVEGKGNYKDSANATWVITSAPVAIETLPTAADITYGQTLADSALSGGLVKCGDDEVTGTFAWKERDTKPAVADSEKTLYTIVFTPDDLKNYNPVEDELTLKILPAPGPDLSEDEKATPNEGLVYTGDEQPLVTEPKELPEGYTKVQYSIDNGETWTDEVPTGTDAETYTVQVKYIGDDNHQDFEGDPISVTIDPASGPDLTEDEKPKVNEGLVYTGEELPLVIGPKELPEGYTGILYSIDGGKTWTDEIPAASEPGEYKVIAKYIGDDNHDDFIGESLKVTIQGGEYSVFSATGAEHVIKDGKDAILTVKRNKEDNRTYKLYTDSTMDGEVLPEGSNTTAEGSLILTLKAAYLDTLSVGEHKVTINFQDGSVDATLKIMSTEPTPTPTTAPTPTPKPVPKTGDGAPLALWLGLILLGLCGLGGTLIWKAKKQK